MIIQFAYIGNRPVYRAYLGDKIVWNYGETTNCSSLLELLTITQGRVADAVRATGEMSAANGSAVVPTATDMPVMFMLIDADGEMLTVPKVQPPDIIGMVSASKLASCATPIIYGIVFGECDIDGMTTFESAPRTAGAVRGQGALLLGLSVSSSPFADVPLDITAVMPAELSTKVIPTNEELWDILVAMISDSEMQTTPKTKELEDAVMVCAADAVSAVTPRDADGKRSVCGVSSTCVCACGSFARDVWEYPVQTDNVLYVPQVYSTEQNGNILTIS